MEGTYSDTIAWRFEDVSVRPTIVFDLADGVDASEWPPCWTTALRAVPYWSSERPGVQFLLDASNCRSASVGGGRIGNSDELGIYQIVALEVGGFALFTDDGDGAWLPSGRRFYASGLSIEPRHIEGTVGMTGRSLISAGGSSTIWWVDEQRRLHELRSEELDAGARWRLREGLVWQLQVDSGVALLAGHDTAGRTDAIYVVERASESLVRLRPDASGLREEWRRPAPGATTLDVTSTRIALGTLHGVSVYNLAGEILWRSDVPAATLAMGSDGTLFAADRHMASLFGPSGEIMWSSELAPASEPTSATLDAGGAWLAGSADGRAWTLHLNRSTGVPDCGSHEPGLRPHE